ncbi:hypothetical protein TNCV_1735451 [Trichonephila clavipes]|nr:hypothetical protein TNCV_1735451 [Trichonephila clavipes]
MLQSLKEQHTSLSEELYITLKNRTEERHTEIEKALRYLHNYNDFKNEKEEKILANSNSVTGSRVFSLTCPLGSLGPELMATLFQPNPRSEA